jgi:hypothetical protein
MRVSFRAPSRIPLRYLGYGDGHLLSLAEWQAITIVTPADFLTGFAGDQPTA